MKKEVLEIKVSRIYIQYFPTVTPNLRHKALEFDRPVLRLTARSSKNYFLECTAEVAFSSLAGRRPARLITEPILKHQQFVGWT